jgi:hypothetical protein
MNIGEISVGMSAECRRCCSKRRGALGGFRLALDLAGGVAAGARREHYAHGGDAFCEWELTWCRM